MSEEEASSGELETSDVNPSVRRPPGGAWGEDVLPVVEWEEPVLRKVLPASVQREIGIALPIVRVSRDIARKQYGKHADVAPLFEAFQLESWSWLRVTADAHGRKWELVQLIEPSEGNAWPLMTVLGEDTSGCANLVSMHRRNRRWLGRLMRGELGFKRRER